MEIKDIWWSVRACGEPRGPAVVTSPSIPRSDSHNCCLPAAPPPHIRLQWTPPGRSEGRAWLGLSPASAALPVAAIPWHKAPLITPHTSQPSTGLSSSFSDSIITTNTHVHCFFSFFNFISHINFFFSLSLSYAAPCCKKLCVFVLYL